MSRYADLKAFLAEHDPIEYLVEVTDREATLDREMQAMRHSVDRMNESIREQESRLHRLHREKALAIEALKLQRIQEAGYGEEATRAHFA